MGAESFVHRTKKGIEEGKNMIYHLIIARAANI